MSPPGGADLTSMSSPALICSFLLLDDDLFLNFRELDAGFEGSSREDDERFSGERVRGNNDVLVAIMSTTSQKTELDCGS